MLFLILNLQFCGDFLRGIRVDAVNAPQCLSDLVVHSLVNVLREARGNDSNPAKCNARQKDRPKGLRIRGLQRLRHCGQDLGGHVWNSFKCSRSAFANGREEWLEIRGREAGGCGGWCDVVGEGVFDTVVEDCHIDGRYDKCQRSTIQEELYGERLVFGKSG